MTTTAPFTIQPRLTQIAMAVKPEGMIADLVCPRIPVESEKFIYSKLISSDLFSIPETEIGRKSLANEVEFGATDITDSILDYALDDFVPYRDTQTAQAAGANIDPQSVATEGVALLLDLSREKRVSDLYFTLNNFDSTLRTTLSGTSQWSDYTNSDPYTAIMAMFDLMLVRPNIGIFGRATWIKLRSHPKIIAAVLNASGGQGGLTATGVASKQAVADLLELDAIYVGESFYNAAKKGQTASYARLWGKHASFLRIDRNVRTVRGMAMPTFAFTAQWQNRFAGTIQDPKRGIRGGTTVRVGEQVKELISYTEAGCHFHDAVA
ncbi:hypothetical protein [Methylomicrobium sp. Wu6]|uniref:major capsid protein n=1 Tax=Methylomicrobium sp. Wu6 TaxID=3107928 RepID=UPI002DD69CCB|nr:hypothetical protein [Methylomicrobium sp. Wu6]MEC4750045.1 major capsid protein [Methylomicrobium sp. Wu6]